MSSPTSVLDLETAYDRLHPTIRKWIREQGWSELKEIQARAIVTILDDSGDVLIAAATAAGKTEAAFLPILTRVAERNEPGFSVLYISPLKALINDQFRRLDELCERMNIAALKWHGDAPQGAKKKALKKPEGVALITPESIEAMFCRRPADARRLLGSAEFIVIDEVHAFLHGSRGLHLSSLLNRIAAVSQSQARRVGLSATIGDLMQAASWLRPTNPSVVKVLEAKSDVPELRLQIRGYVEPPDLEDADRAENSGNEPESSRVALDDIADHVFANLRGVNNLVFGGSRRTVEATADRLRLRSERLNVPNEFFPHHGSLSKNLREDLEERLKSGSLPTTAVCTSTLELGVDIGSVKSVAQIGAPRSLASLRQRLGRTGRREGTPSILRIYVREPHLDAKSGLLDCLRPPTVQSVAAIRLLLAGFVEPCAPSPEVLSTLVHQILSVITERGGIGVTSLYALLCAPGPFETISRNDFATLLRHIGSSQVNLIEQAPDGVLMLGATGEEIVQARDFYAVFETTEEWRLTAGGRPLGTLPISFPVHKESLVVFAGRRWIVEDVDEKRKILEVKPHAGGQVPRFERVSFEHIHDALAAQMRHIYQSEEIPPYLDKSGNDLLAEGRQAFREAGLGRRNLIEDQGDLHVFLWRGSYENSVFGAALGMAGLAAESHVFGITLPNTSASQGQALLQKLGTMESLTSVDVAEFVQNVSSGKFADFVPETLARSQWADRNVQIVRDVPSMARTALVEST